MLLRSGTRVEHAPTIAGVSQSPAPGPFLIPKALLERIPFLSVSTSRLLDSLDSDQPWPLGCPTGQGGASAAMPRWRRGRWRAPRRSPAARRARPGSGRRPAPSRCGPVRPGNGRRPAVPVARASSRKARASSICVVVGAWKSSTGRCRPGDAVALERSPRQGRLGQRQQRADAVAAQSGQIAVDVPVAPGPGSGAAGKDVVDHPVEPMHDQHSVFAVDVGPEPDCTDAGTVGRVPYAPYARWT